MQALYTCVEFLSSRERKEAMMSVEVSIEIGKSPEEVFSYVVTSARACVWRSMLLKRTHTPREAMRVGCTFHEQSKLLDQVLETTYEVIEWLPSQRLTYKSIVGAFPSLVCLRFEATASGTRFTMRVEQSLDLVFPYEKALAMRTMQRILHVDLLTLKDVLENDLS